MHTHARTILCIVLTSSVSVPPHSRDLITSPTTKYGLSTSSVSQYLLNYKKKYKYGLLFQKMFFQKMFFQKMFFQKMFFSTVGKTDKKKEKIIKIEENKKEE